MIKQNIKIILILAFICAGFFCFGKSCRAVNANHVVISEVNLGINNTEWVELYNPTPDDINLDSYSLSDNTNTWNLPDITITSLDHIIIARNATGFYGLYSCYPDIEGLTLALHNDGDKLTLKNGEQEVDFVAWENYVETWNITADTDKSIIRDNVDTDTAADWLSEQTPDPACVYFASN